MRPRCGVILKYGANHLAVITKRNHMAEMRRNIVDELAHR